MKDRQPVLDSRWLRPFANLFGHPALWHLSQKQDVQSARNSRSKKAVAFAW
jgi:hypothetical protein